MRSPCFVVFELTHIQVPVHSEFYYEQPYVEGGGAQTSDITKQRLRR
jgi:hypothetical protein